MAILLPPAPPVPRNDKQQQTAYSNASFWTDWYEKLRTIVNDLATGIDWSNITNTPTTLAGYGITDAAPLSHVGSGGAAHAAATTTTAGFMSAADKTKLDGMTNVTSGTYTPTLTNVANLDSSVAYVMQWMRIGNTVTVGGKIDVNPTAAGLVQLGISLPVASDFTGNFQCGGAAASPGVAGQSAAITGDITNNRAEMQFIAVDLNNRAMYCTFTYTVV